MSVQERGQRKIEETIRKICSRSPNDLAVKGTQSISLGEQVTLGETFRESIAGSLSGTVGFRLDALQVIDLSSSSCDLRLIVPWSGTNVMPHEIYSVVAGRLPWALVLEPDESGLLVRWIWEHGSRGSGALVEAATALGKPMYADAQHAHVIGNAQIPMDWAIQAVPLDDERWVFATHGAPRLLGATFQLDEHLQKLALFARMLSQHPVEGPAKFGFLVPCLSEGFITEEFPEVVQRRVDNRAVEILETARRLLDSGKFLPALRSAEEALAISPSNPDALRLRDEAKSRHAEADRLAKEAKEAARRKDFDAAASANERLLVLYASDKQKVREIKTALDEVNAERIRRSYQSAVALSKEGRKEEAIAHLEKVLELKPNHQMARQLLGQLGG